MAQRVASGCLVFHDGNCLLLRRSALEDTMQGLWEMPAGKIESDLDGSPEENAIRETLEEAGIALGNVVPLGEHLTETKRFYGFLGVSDTADVELSFEHDAFVWMSVPDILAAVAADDMMVGHHTIYFLQELLDGAEGLIYEAESFAAESGDIRINYNANCPACISIMSLIGEEKRETDPANTYWGGGAYQNEVEHLQDGTWDFGDGQGRVQLHEPLLVGGIHHNLLGRAGTLLHEYNNNGNGNILEMGEDEECYDCGGTGEYDCYSDCDDGKRECYNCDGTGEFDYGDGDEACDDCDGSGEEDCTSCDGQTYCEECGGSGEFWNEEIVRGIDNWYQTNVIDYIYAHGDSDIRDALDRLVEGLESGQLRTTYGQEMYSDANQKLYNDLHDAIIYYVINTPNKPLPEGETHDAESFAADSCIECGRKEGPYADTVLIACPGCPELTCQHCYDEEKQGCLFCIRKRAETFSAEKITKEELVEYLDWLEEGEHYMFDSSPRAKRFHDLLAGDLQINSADVDFTDEDEFILLGAEEIPMGIVVKSFKTTSKIYYNRKLVKQFYGPRHREKADSIAGYYARKVQKNPNYFSYLRFGAEDYSEEDALADSIIGQTIFNYVQIRDYLLQNLTDEAIEFLDYNIQVAFDELIDEDMRQQVEHVMNTNRFEAEFVSLNYPFKYSPDYVEKLEQDLNQLVAGLRAAMGVLWEAMDEWEHNGRFDDGDYNSLIEEHPIVLEVMKKTGKAWNPPASSFESESFNYPQGGIYETNMSRQNMSQLSRRDYLKMIRAGHRPIDIRMVYDRLMCSHDNCDQNDVWTFDEYEDGSTFAVDIQWLCPDCGALGEVSDFEFESYDEFWGTDPNLYPVTWYTKRGRRPKWTPEELEIVDLMPVPRDELGWGWASRAESLTGKDMSYCKCGTKDEVGGFTCGQHCSRVSKKSESTSKPARVEIKRATIDPYKLTAVFYDKDDKKIKTTHFGDERYEDYTIHKDKERLKNYNTRHGAKSAGEKWQKPMTAGALSKWILWNKPSLKASFDDYKRRFKLKGELKAKTSGGRKRAEAFATEYTPSQTLGDYDARELALSSVATGDFFTDSLKFSTTRKASEEYNEDNQKMQEAAEKIMEILGEPDNSFQREGGFYASLGEPYTSDMVYVLEYEVLTDDGPKDTWNFGLQMARKLRKQGTEPWSDDRWTGGSPTYAAGAFHLERETFTVTVLEANPAVESVVMDLHQYFADKYGVNGTGFEPAYTVALDEAGNAVTADDIEIDTTWRDSMRGFESEEEDAKKLREYEKTYGKKQAKIRMRLKKKIYKEKSMGTKAGQWSARKSQKLKREYEKACERAGLKPYKTGKTEKQEDLEDWSDQDWKTSSGKKSSKTGEPYFPAKAVEALKKKGLYAKAKRQKAKATKAGKQNARYSDDIRKVVAKYRAESFQADTDVVLYFGTSTQFLEDIERFGLSDPMLTLDLAVADDYAMATAEQYGGNAIVVEVSAFADLLDRVDWQGNIFEYFGDIPPAALYVMDWDDRTGSWS